MSILWAIYPEFWIRMIKYTTNVEDRCSFAQINKYCYELTVRATKISFQSLCYRHMICRYKGETWAEAFSDAPNRPIESTFKKEFGFWLYNDPIRCCPYTGMMARRSCGKKVRLMNIDFGLKMDKILNILKVIISLKCILSTSQNNCY
ncbi:unnamed protein product [Bursaphelenchus okinawaensis]|uniref:Uncharacterized protein n=1 Tax=Bursaphelenchus okinawaensis TaxID=465554 RepID=A0A811JWI3_9BILA|nr:unnamed protein product [Bursaphelenchus okinawaensis]CAG9086278.1 unnamed protein product [Bursaphelenchus okinawaensis]